MSRDLRENTKKILDNLELHGHKFKNFDLIEDFVINKKTLIIILNLENINKYDTALCKEIIEDSLKDFFTKVDFIETKKKKSSEEPEKVKSAKKVFPKIKKVVLISSGKGGVGKSTVTYCLAKSLASQNKKVAVLDADIYGPSIPVIANINKEPEIKEGSFIPIEKHGVKFNSIGFLIPEGKSLVWRGPMITKAIHKLFNSTDWGELDYLLVDMPPGTGDIHLSICEKYHVDSVIMVTTPSEVAEADVKRAEDMYRKLGLTNQKRICNMAYMQLEGQMLYPFGQSKEKHQLPILANHKDINRLKDVLDSMLII